jgi:hypothetical protein
MEWEPKPIAKPCDRLCFATAFGPQPMIDCRSFDAVWPCGRCQQQQGKAVRTAGDCNADALIRRDQRVEITREAFDEFDIDIQASSVIASEAKQ